MNTIMRTGDKIRIVDTVHETVSVLAKNPGIYSIADIQTAINNQLTHEYMSKTIVKRALATIVDRQQKLIRK